MTAKEITINYLKSMQKELENAIELTESEHSKISLGVDYSIIDSVIMIIEEAEGE